MEAIRITEAYYEGYKAFHDDLEISDNPYLNEENTHQEWTNGYRAAEMQNNPSYMN
jgi:hypothetical protein